MPQRFWFGTPHTSRHWPYYDGWMYVWMNGVCLSMFGRNNKHQRFDLRQPFRVQVRDQWIQEYDEVLARMSTDSCFFRCLVVHFSAWKLRLHFCSLVASSVLDSCSATRFNCPPAVSVFWECWTLVISVLLFCFMPCIHHQLLRPWASWQSLELPMQWKCWAPILFSQHRHRLEKMLTWIPQKAISHLHGTLNSFTSIWKNTSTQTL